MPEKKTGKKSIIIVENEEQYSRVASLKLSIEGYDVRQVADSAGLFAEMKKQCPDLVFMDLMLENESGFDALEKMKKNPKFKKVKVIVYSSLAQEDDKAKAKKLGAAEYMVKSEVSLKELVQKVKEII